MLQPRSFTWAREPGSFTITLHNVVITSPQLDETIPLELSIAAPFLMEDFVSQPSAPLQSATTGGRFKREGKKTARSSLRKLENRRVSLGNYSLYGHFGKGSTVLFSPLGDHASGLHGHGETGPWTWLSLTDLQRRQIQLSPNTGWFSTRNVYWGNIH